MRGRNLFEIKRGVARFETSFLFLFDHRSTYSSVDTRSKRSVRMAMMHVTRLSLYSFLFFFPPPSSFLSLEKKEMLHALCYRLNLLPFSCQFSRIDALGNEENFTCERVSRNFIPFRLFFFSFSTPPKYIFR